MSFLNNRIGKDVWLEGGPNPNWDDTFRNEFFAVIWKIISIIVKSIIDLIMRIYYSNEIALQDWQIIGNLLNRKVHIKNSYRKNIIRLPRSSMNKIVFLYFLVKSYLFY